SDLVQLRDCHFLIYQGPKWLLPTVPAVLKSFNFSCGGLFKLCVSDNETVNLFLRSRRPVVLINHFLKTCLYVFNPFFLHIILIRIDFCLDHTIMLTDKNLSYQAVSAEGIFQLFRRNIFAVFRDNEVFLSSSEIDKTIL